MSDMGPLRWICKAFSPFPKYCFLHALHTWWHRPGSLSWRWLMCILCKTGLWQCFQTYLYKLGEGMTLWGEREQIHVQNTEQLHAHDHHQTVTKNSDHKIWQNKLQSHSQQRSCESGYRELPSSYSPNKSTAVSAMAYTEKLYKLYLRTRVAV